jgi:carbamoyl-phosphate synthase large subunit
MLLINKGNVLILSVSRKTLLCRWFLRAAKKYGIKVFGADIDHKAPALSIVDGKIKLPRTDSATFVDELKMAIMANDVRLVVPTRDEELLYLSRNKEQFQSFGCCILCNNADITQRMIDKKTFIQFCIEELGCRNIKFIADWGDALDSDFPLFFRTRGPEKTAKIKVENRDQLRACFMLYPKGIAATFLKGEEVSVDSYISRQRKIMYIVPRSRDVVLGTESIVTTTINAPQCVELTTQLIKKTNISGPIVLQGMLDGSDFVPFEINLRFGGASHLAFKAAHSGPELALREYIMGETLAKSYEYKKQLRLFKEFKEIYTYEQ